jgi:hypothetical protein
VRAIYTNKLLFWVLIIAQFGLVITLSGRVNRLAASTASALFIAYSALTGVTLSFILLLYTAESIFSTFFVCAGMFGALALYGSTTKRNLSGFGQFMFMGLIGVVIASIIGLFWQNDGLQFMISIIGVIVFSGLTVWDAQRLKSLALVTNTGGTSSMTIVGALSLYLNFINLFLFLLRFMGGRRR